MAAFFGYGSSNPQPQRTWTARAVSSAAREWPACVDESPPGNRVCIAMSGGGMRSFVCGVGYLRGLGEPRLRQCGLVSTVSGGSWLYGTYTFALGSARPGMSHRALLAPVRSKEPWALLNRAAVALMLPSLLDMLASNDMQPVWNSLVGQIFLEPYGLNVPNPVAADARQAERIQRENPEVPRLLLPAPGAPAWICNASLMHPPLLHQKLLPILQLSPRYSGIPAMLSDAGTPQGGVLLETFALGAGPPMAPPALDVASSNHGTACNAVAIVTVEPPARHLALRDMLGTSSNAYSSMLLKFGLGVGSALRDVIALAEVPKARRPPANWLAKFPTGGARAAVEPPTAAAAAGHATLKKLVPTMRVWTPENEATTFGDGAFTDNTGIVSLLMHGALNILAFLNTSEKMHMSACPISTDLLALFGAQDTTCAVTSGAGACSVTSESGDTVQVFPTYMLPTVVHQLRAHHAAGGPAWFSGALDVLPNPKYGVTGGWSVQLTLVVLTRCERWVDTLKPAVRKQLDPNFPYYRTIFQNPGQMLQLTPFQIDMLADYTEWCMSDPGLAAALDTIF